MPVDNVHARIVHQDVQPVERCLYIGADLRTCALSVRSAGCTCAWPVGYDACRDVLQRPGRRPVRMTVAPSSASASAAASPMPVPAPVTQAIFPDSRVIVSPMPIVAAVVACRRRRANPASGFRRLGGVFTPLHAFQLEAIRIEEEHGVVVVVILARGIRSSPSGRHGGTHRDRQRPSGCAAGRRSDASPGRRCGASAPSPAHPPARSRTASSHCSSRSCPDIPQPGESRGTRANGYRNPSTPDSRPLGVRCGRCRRTCHGHIPRCCGRMIAQAATSGAAGHAPVRWLPPPSRARRRRSRC